MKASLTMEIKKSTNLDHSSALFFLENHIKTF